MYKYFPHYVMYIPDNLDQQKKVQPIEDTGLKLMEWEHKDYDEAGNSELTETYNGFTVEVRFHCTCYTSDDPICGLKYFIITSEEDTPRYFTDSYIYPDTNSAFNAATEIIDNGEVPE